MGDNVFPALNSALTFPCIGALRFGALLPSRRWSVVGCLGCAGENMAGMSVTGPRSGSAAGPVQQGLKEALIETLTAILSPVQEVRSAAEEQIKVLEVTEGK